MKIQETENSRCFQNIKATHDNYSCRSRKQKTRAAFRTSQLHTIIIHVDPENVKLALLSERHNHTHDYYSCKSRKRKTHAAFKTSHLHTIIIENSRCFQNHQNHTRLSFHSRRFKKWKTDATFRTSDHTRLLFV